MRALLVAIVLMASLNSAPTQAGSCLPGESPFDDVLDASPFCSEALWLRNALVTLGCGSGTTYCPNENVTRAQMALFMKRLARAFTPDIVFSATPSSAGDVDGAGYATCVTDTYTIPANGANIRLLSQGAGTVSILTDGPADLFVGIEMSVNGGLFLPLGVIHPRVLVPGNTWTVVPVLSGTTMTNGSGPALLPGSTYQWRILMQRSTNTSTTGEVTSNRCQLMMTILMDASFL